jgi:hypothetical protein
VNRLSIAIALVTALAFAGCSGGGSGGSTAPNPAGRVPASMSLSIGTGTSVGGLSVFTLSVSAADSSGAAITGTFASPITLTTSDATDTGFSSSATGSQRVASIAVSSSTQPVYFVYDGATLTTAVTITESDPTVAERTFSFQPAPGGTTSAAIASLSLAANGAIPLSGSAGSFTLTLAAYSSTGALISSTYATPIVLTTNDSTDLTLSIAGGTPASSISVTSPSQIVLVSYDGAVVPSGTLISASTSGASTVSIPFVPSSATSGASSAVASIALAQVGALPNQGTAGQFALVITASNGAGGVISGTYPQPIVVSSNDSTDLTFSTVAAGPFTASVSVPNSSTVVYVAYDGLNIPAETKFSASSGATVGTLTFNPAASTVATAPYIKTLYVTTAGAPPEQGTPSNPIYGAQPIYMSAYDQTGAALTGTYPNVIRMSINNATDLQLTIGTYVAATRCEILPPTTPLCPNIGQEVINGSGQAIFADYVDAGPVVAGQALPGGGALQAPQPDISITTDLLPPPVGSNNPPCAVIQFPLSGFGSTEFACQAPNPGAVTISRKSAAKTWRLVPIAARHS